MTNRENFLSLVRRKGYERVPYGYQMCPTIREKYDAWCRETGFVPNVVMQGLMSVPFEPFDMKVYDKYYEGHPFKPGTVIDETGVAHEPGSAAAFHMTKMYYPMQNLTTVDQIEAYPYLRYENVDLTALKKQVDGIKTRDQIAVGSMQCTIWETSWYLRGMNELMMDMLTDEEMAEALFERITHNAILRAQAYAKCGADVLFLGDDVGMQRNIMMSEEMYCKWLKPRLRRVIDAARAVKPDIVVFYHSCGYVLPLIGHLIDAGVEVLDPVQPECMDFEEVHRRFGRDISFHGTLGTQTTMPFGTPREVREVVYCNLDIAGSKGGLLPEPTHLLEPEVPIENVVEYIWACLEYTK